MTIHSYHPDTHRYGLSADCERCHEHALRPLDGLDDVNLHNLYLRITEGLKPRSSNEAIAMLRLADAMEASERVKRLIDAE